MQPVLKRAIVAAVASSACMAANAHHSSAPHYDATRPVQIEGEVTAFEFVNPHSFLHVRVSETDGGTAVWDCETAAAAMLHRRGWKADTFVAGQRIRINGIAARRDPHGCSIQSIVLADGTELRPLGNQGSPEQAPATSTAAATKLNGIVGVWVRDLDRRPNGPAAGPGPADRRLPDRARFTPQGAAANAGYDQRFDDPSFRCGVSSVVRAWSEPGTPTEISLDGDQLKIRHEFMDTVRTARLGVRAHASSLPPTELGHSIAWLEGQTLVIDTVGYAAGVLLPHPGVLHSAALHTMERVSVDPNDHTLHVAWTAEDRQYYASPFSGEFLFRPSLYVVQPYGCTVEHANR